MVGHFKDIIEAFQIPGTFIGSNEVHPAILIKPTGCIF